MRILETHFHNKETRHDAPDRDWLTQVGARLIDAIRAPVQLMQLALQLRRLQREDSAVERQDEQQPAG